MLDREEGRGFYTIERFLTAAIMPGETLHVFSMRLLRLAADAFDGMADLNRVVLPKFMMSLDSDARKAMEAYVLVMPNPSLENLVPLATTLSASHTVPLTTAVYNVSAPQPDGGLTLPPPQPPVNSAPARGGAGRRGAGRGYFASTSRCTYCQSPAHVETDCWVRTSQCFNCLEYGHLRFRCPQQQYHDERGGRAGRGGGSGRAQDNRPTGSGNDQLCAYCGTQGHFMANCRDFLEIMRPGNH